MTTAELLKSIPQINHLAAGNFFLIAGPCVVESKEICFQIAETAKKITEKLEIPYIFKASFRKANRSRLDSFTGIGDYEALEIIGKVRSELKIPVITDVHNVEDVELAAPFADILQIPAFLCRQTELLVAAAESGCAVNIKKGQFLAPEAMKFAAEKILQSGNDRILLTDRGTSFGYYDLIVDYRGLVKMKDLGFPTVLDITHSLQQPNTSEGVTGGVPEMIETIGKAGVAVGVDGIFIETHPDPRNAKSDGANMLPLDKLSDLLTKLVKIRQAIQ